ncbi:hypothetical protein QBC44DRAFT_375676 [Cladorrhinum sp. PSN332]|nr:hypothetical protein QBC44DRAFT_375676 [Cladorrhinum sp. PSN332]
MSNGPEQQEIRGTRAHSQISPVISTNRQRVLESSLDRSFNPFRGVYLNVDKRLRDRHHQFDSIRDSDLISQRLSTLQCAPALNRSIDNFPRGGFLRLYSHTAPHFELLNLLLCPAPTCDRPARIILLSRFQSLAPTRSIQPAVFQTRATEPYPQVLQPFQQAHAATALSARSAVSQPHLQVSLPWSELLSPKELNHIIKYSNPSGKSIQLLRFRYATLWSKTLSLENLNHIPSYTNPSSKLIHSSLHFRYAPPSRRSDSQSCLPLPRWLLSRRPLSSPRSLPQRRPQSVEPGIPAQ